MRTHDGFHRVPPRDQCGADNRMKIDELRAIFESLGLHVETYIQRGNVVSETTETTEGELRDAIHDAIEGEFGYDISIMISTQPEPNVVTAILELASS